LIDGQPVQVVQPSADVSIKSVDLSSFSEDTRQTEIALTIKSETERPFDLSAGQLLRCTLIRAQDDDHVLILTTHHSVCDAWSMGILTRELWTLYDAFSKAQSSPLQPLPVQYSDYALWQRNWLQGDVLQSQIDYWNGRLKDLPVLNFPTDRPRKPHQSFRGARLPIGLPEHLTRSVNQLSDRFAVTPFMTLLAAFQVLLYRYTGQEDVVLGSPIANRRRPELEGLIGFFVNTLVLRGDLSGNPSFSKFLSRVRDTCVGADANQDLPFEKLVQELQPERDQSRNPLFQVMFVLQNATRPFTGVSGVRIEPVEVATWRSLFDISLFLRERDGKYIGYIEYSTDLFDPDRIERMAGHYRTLLEAIVANPDQSIATLPILTESERHQILFEWNYTAADYPKDKCIHHLFEEQVERTPEAIAVEFENQQITYRELNQRANQLAHYLISLGIGSENLVGICIERSVEMVVGLLGILKAGGAYVPLDPAYPQERLRFMLEDSQVSVLFTTQDIVEDRKWRIENGGDLRSSILNPRLRIVSLDRDSSVIERQSTENPTAPVTSRNLAYVIYTSGSTGKPKGVRIEHRSVVNCLIAIGKQIDLSPQNKWLAGTTISFDIAALELFSPLITGAKLVLANSEESGDATRLIAQLKTSQANVMQATPSMWQLLFEMGWQCPAGFTILCGGEALKHGLADRFLNDTDSVWNLYGPTESTIWSTMARVTPDASSVPIGRPIANTQVYILDSNLQPVPIGVPGELYIGGDGLARGYLNRAQLTAERFIRNLFSADPDALVYRTGDRARYRPDGNIEFLGRCDDQVKIRGHRIELGEIEATLAQHPRVKECAAAAVEASRALQNPTFEVANPKSLAAYIVPVNEPVDVVELGRFLAEKLPDYMLPSFFVSLGSLPRTPNGKTDRNALPPPDAAAQELQQKFVEPRDEIEELVAQVWREVLKRERVGVFDNFFDLGGHSLLATNLVSRLSDVFNTQLTLRHLFDAPTVAGLTAEIESIRDGAGVLILPPITIAPRNAALPLSLNQEHLWYFDRKLPGTHFFNMPYSYLLTGEVKLSALQSALTELVERHEALRTVFADHDGTPLQIVTHETYHGLECVDFQSTDPDLIANQAAITIREERKAPFDLSRGPLFRTKLLRLTSRTSILLITLHHIIGDHSSIQILMEEIACIYEGLITGKLHWLDKPVLQFADYAFWERCMIEQGRFNRALDFWRERLIPNGQLDSHDSRSLRRSFSSSASQRRFELNEYDFANLKTLARNLNCTPTIIVLTGLVLLLFRQTGQDEIRFGLLMNNRRNLMVSRAIGNFANTVVVRVLLSPEMTLRNLVGVVRTSLLDAHANQEVPFEWLANAFDEQTPFGRALLFQVLVMYRQSSREKYELPGLEISPMVLPRDETYSDAMLTSYDLVLDLKESSTKLTGSVNVKSVNAVTSNNDVDNGMLKCLREFLYLDLDSRIAE